MLPLTADETIYKVYMHCLLSPGQSLLRACSRSCLLCLSCMYAFCTLNQVSTPQSLRCTSLLSRLCFIVGREANHKWEFMMRGCTQLLLYTSQANPELGNTTVPCSAPGRLFLTASLPQAAKASPFQRRAGTNGCRSQLGNHNLWHSLPAKTRAWQLKCFFSSPFLGGGRH